MFEKSTALFLYNLSPLHAGAGEGHSGIDLPIQREGHTKYPKIEASGIKGALKESFKRNGNQVSIGGNPLTVNELGKINGKEEYVHISLVFGPEEGDLHSSAIGFSDARLLLFPVPSMRGTFAWITCPDVLNQFMWDMQRILPDRKLQWEGLNALASSLRNDEDTSLAYVVDGNELEVKPNVLLLQEYPFSCLDRADNELSIKEIQADGKENKSSFGDWLAQQKVMDNIGFLEKLSKDIVVVSNDDFRDFVEMDTEVITRIRIDSKTGIVEDGALFTEEYLPAQSLMYAAVSFAPVFMPEAQKKKLSLKTADEVQQFYIQGQQPYWQVGGNATLGKGMMHLKLVN